MAYPSDDPRARDTEVVRRVLAGDASAYDELVLKYRELVYAISYQVLQDTYAAEDVCQNAFLAAYRSLDSLHDAGSFAPWLRKIALRECSAWARGLVSRRTAEERDNAASVVHDPWLQDAAERDEKYAAWCERIERATEALSRDHCEILSLFYVRDLSHDEIAHFLGIPKGTVKRRLFDARKSLQDALGARTPSASQQEEARRYLEAFHRALAARTGADASDDSAAPET